MEQHPENELSGYGAPRKTRHNSNFSRWCELNSTLLLPLNMGLYWAETHKNDVNSFIMMRNSGG